MAFFVASRDKLLDQCSSTGFYVKGKIAELYAIQRQWLLSEQVELYELFMYYLDRKEDEQVIASFSKWPLHQVLTPFCQLERLYHASQRERFKAISQRISLFNNFRGS